MEKREYQSLLLAIKRFVFETKPSSDSIYICLSCFAKFLLELQSSRHRAITEQRRVITSIALKTITLIGITEILIQIQQITGINLVFHKITLMLVITFIFTISQLFNDLYKRLKMHPHRFVRREIKAFEESTFMSEKVQLKPISNKSFSFFPVDLKIGDVQSGSLAYYGISAHSFLYNSATIGMEFIRCMLELVATLNTRPRKTFIWE